MAFFIDIHQIITESRNNYILKENISYELSYDVQLS